MGDAGAAWVCWGSVVSSCVWAVAFAAAEGMMVREMVASGSWSSNVWAEVRSWRKRDGGCDWIACRDMVG